MAERASLARLRAVIAAYGARSERWPADERADLERLLARHPGAPFLAEAREIDVLLDAVPGAVLRPGLAAAIVAAAGWQRRADPARVVVLAPADRGWRRRAAAIGQAALLAASLAAGLWLGGTGLADQWLPVAGADSLLTSSTLGADEANFLAAVGADEVSL